MLFGCLSAGQLCGAQGAYPLPLAVGSLPLGPAELLTLIRRSLLVRDEVGQHAADTASQIVETGIGGLIDIALVVSDGHLRTDLTAGAFGDEQKLDKLGLGAAFETFRDIGHNRNRGAPV